MQHGMEGGASPALTSMLAAGLGEPEILQLVSLRMDIVAGKRSEATAEHKRLLFARYLYQHGALQG